MLFQTEKAFIGGDTNYEQLLSIAEVLGTADLHVFLRKHRLSFKPKFEKLLPTAEPIERKPWTAFITSENSHLISEEALDLLSSMMIYDPAGRVTPKDAMNHVYF